jgi:hypothetical protein
MELATAFAFGCVLIEGLEVASESVVKLVGTWEIKRPSPVFSRCGCGAEAGGACEGAAEAGTVIGFPHWRHLVVRPAQSSGADTGAWQDGQAKRNMGHLSETKKQSAERRAAPQSTHQGADQNSTQPDAPKGAWVRAPLLIFKGRSPSWRVSVEAALVTRNRFFIAARCAAAIRFERSSPQGGNRMVGTIPTRNESTCGQGGWLAVLRWVAVQVELQLCELARCANSRQIARREMRFDSGATSSESLLDGYVPTRLLRLPS